LGLRVALVNDGLGKCRFGTAVPGGNAGRPASGRRAALAIVSPAWQGSDMTNTSPRQPTGSGAIIALLTLAGTFIGGFMGQPSAGLLAGLAAGFLVALLLWLRERNR
jgi:hypothetical protein